MIHHHPAKRYGFILISFLLIACNTSVTHQVVEQYPDGATKTIHYFRKRGQNKVLYKMEEYYQDGIKKIEGFYRDDKAHGRWDSWHPNGNLWSVARYKNGQLHGKQTVYYPTGKKFYEGSFENGIRKGTWLFWNEKGEVVNKREY